ncbi:MAG TPA: flagellar basal body P-ring protein FlgI, partial [Pseudomonadales bacterium]|nr:flagellar basal body P-ring protein FlgI [Pseudomonadales bacterium]
GSMTVVVSERPAVSQPGAFAGRGETVVVPQSTLEVKQEGKPMWKLGAVTTIDELVTAVNRVGAAPGDLMAILEALKQAGALRAELIVI